MELSKILNYDDFYKFTASFGVLVLTASLSALAYFYSIDKLNDALMYIVTSIAICGAIVVLVICYFWYRNKQRVLDEKEKEILNRIKLENNMIKDVLYRVAKVEDLQGSERDKNYKVVVEKVNPNE